MNRYTAFFIHLSLSAFIALVSAAVVFFVWYPQPLASATGVVEIFMLLLLVDVTIGPVLTLVVFNPAKKALKFDLALIGIIQFAALLYGLHTVFVARPVYEVFSIDRFELVYANELTEEKVKRVNDPAFKMIPMFGPEPVAALMPENADKRNRLLFSAIAGGDDLAQSPEFYIPYASHTREILNHVLPIEQLIVCNPQAEPVLALIKRRYADIGAGIGYLPLKTKLRDQTAIIRKDNADILEIANLLPWCN